ncbi:Atrnl1 [Symbiodinium sp. KB8]|nr:Atrnl1 [Symbiodinium sp. KB8]
MDVATTPPERRKASAAKEFLKSYWCKRVVLLTRAMHPWITMQYVSLFRSHVVRASLIILKLVSTGAANALFFAASAVSTDSERDCRPPENFGERLLRAGVVGILSACMSDLLILLLAAVQWRQVIIRHWTEEAKKRQLRSWRWRRRFFWLIWFVDMGMSILYIFGFLANVSETDGSKWLESTGISLLQDLLLKPLYMALLYGTVASMVLCCSPSVGNEVVGQWMQRDEEDASRADVQARTLCCGGASKSPQHLSVRSRHKAASDVKLVLGRRGLVQGIKFKAPDSAVPGITKADSLEGPLKATLKMKGEFNLSEGPFGLSFGLRRQLNLGSPPYPAFPMSRWFQHPCSKSAFCFILFALQIAVLASANDWTLLSPQGNAGARSGHTMVWDTDEDDGGFWLFGGGNSNKLYFYNAASNKWTQKALGPAVQTRPAARYGHSAVWDPTARTMYVFAGTTAGSAGNTFNDLHRYDVQLDSFSELTGTAGRSMHTAVWDSTSDRMIVFGGLDDMLNKLDSLAEYDRATDSWSSPAAVGPVPRDGHVAVWDPATGTMLMCCGASSAATLGDLWSYNGAWSQLAPSGSITARSYASAVWDPQAGALLGFAGSGGSKLNSLFLYSASANSWSEYTETGPPALDRGAVAWDPVNGRLYAFGGYDDNQGMLDTLWRLDEFLKSYWCKRVVLLTRAMHPWVTMQYVSLFRSHVVRASLIILKLVSTGAANALFFAASAVSTDSERDCRPPENFGERLVRAGVVGILSACMSDLLILLLAAVQWRQVIIRHWTEEAKKRQLRSWRWRRRFFWLIWFVDMGMSILYIFGFLANVSETDGSKWLESTGISLLQDLLLKPLYMALLYGTVATMVLCCSPSVGNEVVGQWMQRDEEDASRADVQARPESHSLRPVCECDADGEIDEIYIDTL